MLIANPKATSTSRRARDILVRAFSGDLDLVIAETAHRGHATELAWQAAVDGYDVVIALGGDGTVNEAVNGLLAEGPSPELPALAVLPIGSANVFARALGLPGDVVGATRAVLEALRAGRFYASSGLELSAYEASPSELSLELAEDSAAVELIGSGGTVLETVSGSVARFRLSAAGSFARIRATTSDGRQLWTQPIFR